jgi:hypothetical protein
MDDHSSCIDDLAESRLNLKIDLFLENGVEFFEGEEFVSQLGKFFFVEEFFAQLSQSLSYGFDDDIPGMDL